MGANIIDLWLCYQNAAWSIARFEAGMKAAMFLNEIQRIND